MASKDPEPPFQYTGAWWQKLPDEQVRAHMDGNMPTGMAFEGARLELERRDRERRGKRDRRIAIASLILAGIAAAASVVGLFR